MTRAQVLTSWAAGPLGDSRPAVLADHPPQSWADVTGQPAVNIPTSPNVLVVEGVWDDAAFAALLADPAYGDGAVLWSEAA